MNYPYRSNQRKPKKTLSWSNTRITLLEYCERKYFLNYYTFALKDNNPDLRAEEKIEELKNNMRIEMKADFDYSKERDYADREDFFGKF